MEGKEIQNKKGELSLFYLNARNNTVSQLYTAESINKTIHDQELTLLYPFFSFEKIVAAVP